MKNATLLLVALSAFVVEASAQSNVTIYGVADIGLTRDSNGAAAGSTTRMDSGNLYGNRLGFKGTEDIGGGLSAIFNIESGFDGSTGAMGQGGLLFGRQAWVGMKGGFGTVRMGRMWETYYTALFSTVDPFGDGLVGGASRLMGAGGVRMNNAIDYQTPELGGFYGEVAHSLGEVAGNTSANSLWSVKAGYAAGALDVVASHYNQNNAAAVGGATKNTLLGASYNFNIAKVSIGYDWLKGDTNASSNVLDQRDLLIGLNVPMGGGNLLASYIRKSDKLNADADSSQASIAYTYPLSKRTTLYTAYARTSNDGAARYNLDATAPSGAKASAIQAGMTHTF